MRQILIILTAVIVLVIFIRFLASIIKKDKIKKQELIDKEYCKSIYESYKKHHKEEMELEVACLRRMYECNENAHNLEKINNDEYQNNLKGIHEAITKVEQKYGME